MQPTQTVNATNLLPDEASHDDCGCNINGDKSSCTITTSSDSRGSGNLTREEVGRLACMPGFVTPEQITLQDKEENDGNGERGTNPKQINALILIDEEAYDFYYDLFEYMYGPVNPYSDVWAEAVMWTTTILETGDDYMESQYGIDFIAYQFATWTSNDTMNYYQLLDDAVNKINPASYGCDVVVIMSGQDGYNSAGSEVSGIAFILAEPFFIMNVNVDYPCHAGWHSGPLDHLFAHEASHLFDCGDHTDGHVSSSVPCCVMCYSCCDISKINYCSACDLAMYIHRFRFDSAIVGFATVVTDYYVSGGGASATNLYGIIGLINDGNCACLYSGSLGNKSVLYIQVNLPPSTAAISGTVYLRAHSLSSPGNHMLIYKSVDGINWVSTPIINTNVYSPYTPIDINCGYVSNFRYLSIVVYNDYGYDGTVYIDTVHVHA